MKPGQYVDLVFPDADVVGTRRRVQPGDSVTDYGTVMFEVEIMRRMIRFEWFDVRDPQRPWVRQEFGPVLGDWLSAVPECYRDAVSVIAVEMFRRVFSGELYRGRLTLEWFVHELRAEIWSQLESIPP